MSDHKAEAKRLGFVLQKVTREHWVESITAALEAADASAEERTRVHYEALIKASGVEIIECPDCAGRTPTPDNCYFGDCSCHGRRYHIRNTDTIAAEKRGRVAGLREAAGFAYDKESCERYSRGGDVGEACERRAEEVERAQRLLDTAAGPVFTTQTKPDPSKGVEKS